MRFFYDNLIDYAGVTIAPSSEVATLPARNVANEMRKRVWRTGTTLTTEHVTFDLGQTKSVKGCVVDATGDAEEIQLAGNSANDFTTPPFSVVLSRNDGEPWMATFATQAYRFWRVSIVKSDSAIAFDTGRVFIGSFYDTPEQPDYDGFEQGLEDLSTIQKTIGGQTYVNLQPTFTPLRFEFSQIRAAMANQLRAIAESVGIARSFFVQPDPSASAGSPLARIYYVKFRKEMSRKVAGFDDDLTWNLKLEMDEQL